MAGTINSPPRAEPGKSPLQSRGSGLKNERPESQTDLHDALRLEWRRKIEAKVRQGCRCHWCVQSARRSFPTTRPSPGSRGFWELLLRTVEAAGERSPWLDLRKARSTPGAEETGPAIFMTWRGRSSPELGRPDPDHGCHHAGRDRPAILSEPIRPPANCGPMPHTRVRQITDRPMTAEMLIPTEGGNERTNAPGAPTSSACASLSRCGPATCALARCSWCASWAETALIARDVPPNVQVRHFNDISGEKPGAMLRSSLSPVGPSQRPGPSSGPRGRCRCRGSRCSARRAGAYPISYHHARDSHV